MFQVAPQRGKVLLRSSLLLGCIVVGMLCAAEVLLRVTDFNRPRGPTSAFGPYRFDAELGWFAAPHTSAQAISTNRTISTKHNSLGLRERELSDIAPDRILFLGDSFTWGYDAEVPERFTDLLQKELPQYGMVNAGVSGFGTDQQFLLMQRLWSDVRPKVVVLTFCVDNDRDDNSTNRRAIYYKPYFVRTPGGKMRVRGYPLPQLRRSDDKAEIDGVALISLAAAAYASVRNRQIVVPDPTEHLIDLMRRTVEARGARFVVGLQRHQPELEAHLRAQKIPYTTFDDAPAYPTAGWHWTPEGNSMVAKGYRMLFAEAGILPSLTPSPAQPADLDPPVAIRVDGTQPEALSVLSPSFWRDAARAVPDELIGLGRFLEFWSITAHDSRALPRLAVALLGLTIIGIAISIFLFWRHRQSQATSGPPTEFAKAISSFGVFLGFAMATPFLVVTLLETAGVRMIEISYGLVAGLFFAALGRAVAFGVFAPYAPQRRLLMIDDAGARVLAGYLVWATRAVGVLLLALSVHKALAAPPELIAATNTLFSFAIGGLLLHLLLSHCWNGEEALARVAWLRPLGWIILGTIAVVLAAGYPTITALAAQGLVSIASVVGVLYLVLGLGRALFAEQLAVDGPHGRMIAAGFGVGTRWLGFGAILACGGMLLAIMFGALVLYIGLWQPLTADFPAFTAR